MTVGRADTLTVLLAASLICLGHCWSSYVDAQGNVAEESVHVANKVHVRREDTVKRAPLIRREVSRVEAPKAALIQEHAAATTVGQEVGGEAGNPCLEDNTCSCNDGFYLEDNTCKTKATCDSFTFPTTCPTDAPVHGGSGVECSTDIASCDSSTCCEACPNSDGVTGYKFDHLGYWHHAHIAQGSTTTDGDCAGKCDAYPGCIAFNRNQNNGDCFVYTILNTEKIGTISKAYTKCTILNDRPSDQAMPTLTGYDAWSQKKWCSTHYGGQFTPVADLVAACDADDQCQGIWWARSLNLGVRCSSASFSFTHHNDQECAAKASTPLSLLLTKETVSARGDGQLPCLQSCNLQDKKVLEHGDKCTPSCSEGMAAKDAEFECKDGELYDGDAIADPEDLKCK